MRRGGLTRAKRGASMRRGAVLLELLVALAIFIVGATTLLAVFGDVAASVARDSTTALAVDLARTRMSEIEAGLISPEDLRPDAGAREVGDGLVAEAVISRSGFPGLSLVEIRVTEGPERELRYALRQLMAMPRLRGAGDDREPELDLDRTLEGAP